MVLMQHFLLTSIKSLIWRFWPILSVASSVEATTVSSSSHAVVVSPVPIASSTYTNGVVLLAPPQIPRNVAPVRLDVYEDLLCPDCRAFQPVLSDIVKRYTGSRLEVVFHFFPLPYHRNSYAVNSAALGLVLNVTESSPGETLSKFRDAVFAVQEVFGNVETSNMTMHQVAAKVGEVASSAGLPADLAVDSVWDRSVDLQLRVASKAAWLRGVTGTPSLYLNSAPLYLAGDGVWTTSLLEDVIDPILEASNRVDEK